MTKTQRTQDEVRALSTEQQETGHSHGGGSHKWMMLMCIPMALVTMALVTVALVTVALVITGVAVQELWY